MDNKKQFESATTGYRLIIIYNKLLEIEERLKDLEIKLNVTSKTE